MPVYASVSRVELGVVTKCHRRRKSTGLRLGSPLFNPSECSLLMIFSVYGDDESPGERFQYTIGSCFGSLRARGPDGHLVFSYHMEDCLDSLLGKVMARLTLIYVPARMSVSCR